MADQGKPRRGRTDRTEGFNEQSGAEQQRANGAVAPVLSKAQLLVQLKQRLPRFNNGTQIVLPDGEELTPTPNQRNLINNIQSVPINLVEGTLGTGKTMWTCYMALLGVVEKKYNRICLNAPVVTAGEDVGFLKGDLDQKMLPHVNQILEAFDDFIGEDLRKKLSEAGVIKVEPHAFLRGRSLKKTFFILDECQNATGPNLQTALSRLGNDSTFVFLGDRLQNDRTESDPAFKAFIERYTHPAYEGYVAHSELGAEDVKRHPFLKLMVERGDHMPLPGHETHRTRRVASSVPASVPASRPAATQPQPS